MALKHITKEYTGLGLSIAPTYCGYNAKTIWELTNNTLMRADCLKCIDLYYQDHPNADCGRNPYFCAHNPGGNSRLRKIKADQHKQG